MTLEEVSLSYLRKSSFNYVGFWIVLVKYFVLGKQYVVLGS